MQNYDVCYYMSNGEKFNRIIKADNINEVLMHVSSGAEFSYGDGERRIVIITKYIQAIEINKR